MLGQKNTFCLPKVENFHTIPCNKQSERPYYKWFGFTNTTNNNQSLKSAGDNDKVKTLLLHCCALRKFHATDSQNTRDHITSDRRSKRA